MAEQKGRQESDIASLQYAQEYYQSRYIAIERSLEEAYNYLSELNETKESISNASKISNRNILTPIGSGAYLNAKIVDADRFVIGVGGGFFVEKDVSDASAFTDRSIKSQNELIGRLTKSKEELERMIIETASALDEASRADEMAGHQHHH